MSFHFLSNFKLMYNKFPAACHMTHPTSNSLADTRGGAVKHSLESEFFDYSALPYTRSKVVVCKQPELIVRLE